jgi:hypothetical protein
LERLRSNRRYFGPSDADCLLADFGEEPLAEGRHVAVQAVAGAPDALVRARAVPAAVAVERDAAVEAQVATPAVAAGPDVLVRAWAVPAAGAVERDALVRVQVATPVAVAGPGAQAEVPCAPAAAGQVLPEQRGVLAQRVVYGSAGDDWASQPVLERADWKRADGELVHSALQVRPVVRPACWAAPARWAVPLAQGCRVDQAARRVAVALQPASDGSRRAHQGL